MEASPVERSTTDRFHWSVSSALGAQARTILLPSGLKNCCQLRTTPPSKWYRVVREPCGILGHREVLDQAPVDGLAVEDFIPLDLHPGLAADGDVLR